ncbi:hypothetical protein A3K70_00240 [Candidatus Bathyarchaeota archaeon RBG_16_48_13]|nr:MAG: hypothetical protein A3K70_00240 [Candidatus Bathyarchaeota archaeon RBG_16_48_13]
MPQNFRLPDIGEGIAEAEIVKWEVKEGDMIQEHQQVVKIETDKAIVELPSPKSGIVLKIHHREGDMVKVGETLMTIGGPDEKLEGFGAIPASSGTSVVGVLEEAPMIAAKPPQVLATPATRKLAKDLNVDLTQITGTGPEGRITDEDVKRISEGKSEREIEPIVKIAKEYDLYGYYKTIPLKGVRRSTAKKMTESKRIIPHVTHMDEADVTELERIKEKQKEIEKQDVHITYLPFVIKAVVAALKEYPYLNSSLNDETEEIIVKKYYNIGVAVDTEDGLIVPVIKAADQKSIVQLAKEIQVLAEKTRSREVDLADLKGGTFTITNVGFIGGLYATPIINYPESAILALGRIYEKPVAHDEEIKIRRIMPLSLSFDHRVIDGAMAARFVNTVIKYVGDPSLLLLEKE